MQNRTRGAHATGHERGGGMPSRTGERTGERGGGDRMKYFITEKTGRGRIFVFIFGFPEFGFRRLKFFHLEWLRKNRFHVTLGLLVGDILQSSARKGSLQILSKNEFQSNLAFVFNKTQ